MAVNMIKRSAKHAACDTWQDYGVPCVGHGPYCDRVVAVNVTAWWEDSPTLMFVGPIDADSPVVHVATLTRHSA